MTSIKHCNITEMSWHWFWFADCLPGGSTTWLRPWPWLQTSGCMCRTPGKVHPKISRWAAYDVWHSVVKSI